MLFILTAGQCFFKFFQWGNSCNGTWLWRLTLHPTWCQKELLKVLWKNTKRTLKKKTSRIKVTSERDQRQCANRWIIKPTILSLLDDLFFFPGALLFEIYSCWQTRTYRHQKKMFFSPPMQSSLKAWRWLEIFGSWVDALKGWWGISSAAPKNEIFLLADISCFVM